VKVRDVLKKADEIMKDAKRVYHHARQVKENLHDAQPDAETNDPFATERGPKRRRGSSWEEPTDWREARRLAAEGKVDNAAEAIKVLEALSSPPDPSATKRP